MYFLLLNWHKEQILPLMGFSMVLRGKSTAWSKKHSKSSALYSADSWGGRKGWRTPPRPIHTGQMQVIWKTFICSDPLKLPARHLHSHYVARTPLSLWTVHVEGDKAPWRKSIISLYRKRKGWDSDLTSQALCSQVRVSLQVPDLGPPLLQFSFELILFAEMSMDKMHFPVLGLFQWLTGALLLTHIHPLKWNNQTNTNKIPLETHGHPARPSSMV